MIRCFLIFGLFIFLQGCQTTGNFENKAEISQKSFINKIKSVAKKPKYAPYDWKPSDVNSREIWFENSWKLSSFSLPDNCYWFYKYKGKVKDTFLRNGNTIVEKRVRGSVTQIIDVSYEPKDKIVFIEGLSDLKPSSIIRYEIKEGLKFIKVKFIYKYKDKEKVGTCDIYSKYVQKRTKLQRIKIEKAKAKAKQRIAKLNKFAPILQAKKKETNNPVIKINSLPKKVDNLNLIVRGNVSDDSGVAIILMQGEKVKVTSDGRFIGKIKLGYGLNNIKIQAEDINGNVSEKNIKIIREEYISEQELVDIDFPPKTKMNNPNALAVVIGIENYQYVPDATYAYNDAEVFREYLADTLGFKKQKIKIATNSKATQAELNKLLGSNGWLSRNIVKRKSDIVVYFSGHGIANQKDKSTSILPFDVDPNYSVGLPLKKLYKDLNAMGARSVTVYLDACFTGQTRDAKMLIANARPIIILPKEQDIPDKVNLLTAASGSQISGAIKEKEHGLFTYYVLRGLSGDADTNKDKVVKLKELYNYVSKNVREQAALNGREQFPQLKSDQDKVIVKFD